MRRESKIGMIIEMTSDTWDRPEMPSVVRETFRKVSLCGTLALGAEVFASDHGELVVCHTCKSWACCSCGNRQTLDWQREQRSTLPDIPFRGLTFTMPCEFWPIFQQNRHIQRLLPALGAAAIEGFAMSHFGVRILVLVVMQTFGDRLNYHPHLHVMVSAGGLNTQNGSWLDRIDYDQNTIMELWRFGVLENLSKAHTRGLLNRGALDCQFPELLNSKRDLPWRVYMSRKTVTKEHFLGHNGRYIRRPPIAQRRIISISEDEVLFTAKRKRGEAPLEISLTPQEFVMLLAQHVPDRYQNTMRYFGLLAPRARLWMDNVFAALNQTQRSKPKRLSHEDALIESFKRNPYLDSQSKRMRWTRSILPSGK
jgi:hypothetical protein